MNAAPKDVVGYPEPLSVATQGTLDIKASTYGPDVVDLDFVQITGCGWSSETGALPDISPVSHPAAGQYPCKNQRVKIGSYGTAPVPLSLSTSGKITLAILVRPHARQHSFQALMALQIGNAAWVLAIDDNGCPVFIDPNKVEIIRASSPLTRLSWYSIALSIDVQNGQVELVIMGLNDQVASSTQTKMEGAFGPSSIGKIWFGAAPSTDGSEHNFDGCLESPVLCESSAPSAAQAIAAAPDGWKRLGADVLAKWDFSREIPTRSLIDLGPSRCDGQTVNSPTRAIRGAFWAGDTFDWPSKPQDYGAIHFHSDDLDDCNWETTAEITIPDEWKSGLYAARLKTKNCTDMVPFVVRAPKDKRNDVALLLPSFTYTSYANAQPALRGPNLGVSNLPDEATLAAHPEFGHSQYDHYADRSPVMLSSRNRPLLSMRFGALPWGLIPDTWIMSWLAANGTPYDMLIDEDLDRDGLDAIQGAKVVITGNHPEYYTAEMLNALDAFVNRGGRLMYMGGNGFYWRVSTTKNRPGQIEIRRNEDGTRAWIGEPGDGYHMMDGKYGGLWRRLNRPPNLLAGVGFAAQGFDESGHYCIEPDARSGPAAFALEGITSDIVGAHGWLGGGAAGQEIDRVDSRLSDISQTYILARSAGHPESMLRTKEELLSTILPFEDPNAKAHLALRVAGEMGAIFSVGSMAWAGSLATNGFDNDVAKITSNVLNRFLDPTAFGRA